MKKRVAFLVSSLNTGGAQRAVSNITVNFPEDWEIDLILNSEENIVYPYRGNIISLKMEEPKNRMSLIYQGKVFLKRFWKLKNLKRDNNYVAVISFLDSANIVNILTGNRYCKTIVSVRSRLSGVKSWQNKFIVNNLVKLLYNHADKVVAISEGVRYDLIQNFGIKEEKTCTIYNCYNLEEIQKKAKDQNEQIVVADEELAIVTMGRLMEAKGHWHLIRAFSEVVKEEKQARLYILGQGKLENYLRKLAEELGIEDYVKFCGFIENPFSVISKAKIFIFPSLYEGFGNALVEAMSCGIPCIATDFKYGAREILQKEKAKDFNKDCTDVEMLEYGILTPVCSYYRNEAGDALEQGEVLMKEALLKLLRDDVLHKTYAEKAVEGATYFTPEKTIEAWVELLCQ